MKLYVILDNMRSEHNVGSIFRTADGTGVARIFLCGYTPRPIDRFGREVAEIKKTSLGATDSVPWEYREHLGDLIGELKQQGITVVSVEQHARAIPYTDMGIHDDTAFIFGNEIEGVSPEALAFSDHVIHIPMHGVKESLNVSVAAGIILFHARTLHSD